MAKMLSAKEFADYFNVSETTVWNWKRRGLVNYTKIGQTVRFDLEKTLEKAEKQSE